MESSQFRCIRCSEIKSNPDDRIGTPRFIEKLNESIGLCLDCGAKEPKVENHPAQAAMDDLAQYATLYGFLDHLSESRYKAIDFGHTKPKNLTIDKFKDQTIDGL
jgi:hypothetical protein